MFTHIYITFSFREVSLWCNNRWVQLEVKDSGRSGRKRKQKHFCFRSWNTATDLVFYWGHVTVGWIRWRRWGKTVHQALKQSRTEKRKQKRFCVGSGSTVPDLVFCWGHRHLSRGWQRSGSCPWTGLSPPSSPSWCGRRCCNVDGGNIRIIIIIIIIITIIDYLWCPIL